MQGPPRYPPRRPFSMDSVFDQAVDSARLAMTKSVVPCRHCAVPHIMRRKPVRCARSSNGAAVWSEKECSRPMS